MTPISFKRGLLVAAAAAAYYALVAIPLGAHMAQAQTAPATCAEAGRQHIQELMMPLRELEQRTGSEWNAVPDGSKARQAAYKADEDATTKRRALTRAQASHCQKSTAYSPEAVAEQVLQLVVARDAAMAAYAAALPEGRCVVNGRKLEAALWPADAALPMEGYEQAVVLGGSVRTLDDEGDSHARMAEAILESVRAYLSHDVERQCIDKPAAVVTLDTLSPHVRRMLTVAHREYITANAPLVAPGRCVAAALDQLAPMQELGGRVYDNWRLHPQRASLREQMNAAYQVENDSVTMPRESCANGAMTAEQAVAFTAAVASATTGWNNLQAELDKLPKDAAK